MRLKAKMICEQWINDNAVATGEVITFDISRMVKEMPKAELDKLIGKLSRPHGQDLDYIAELAGVADNHSGPRTVEIDVEDLQKFVESGFDCSARYLVTADSHWGHLFDDSGRETITQFVYDTQEETMVAVLMQRDAALDKWDLASDDEAADLEDSLVNANQWALDDPEEAGLDYTDDLPEWAVKAPALAM